ncbi:hypothetical protein BC831DRAFT_67596 [Entophlyctis helioformis]|nr:hypothetical protein BC831DRAFT_67596 [Entophlyctis helioformis]
MAVDRTFNPNEERRPSTLRLTSSSSINSNISSLSSSGRYRRPSLAAVDQTISPPLGSPPAVDNAGPPPQSLAGPSPDSPGQVQRRLSASSSVSQSFRRRKSTEKRISPSSTVPAALSSIVGDDAPENSNWLSPTKSITRRSSGSDLSLAQDGLAPANSSRLSATSASTSGESDANLGTSMNGGGQGDRPLGIRHSHSTSFAGSKDNRPVRARRASVVYEPSSLALTREEDGAGDTSKKGGGLNQQAAPPQAQASSSGFGLSTSHTDLDLMHSMTSPPAVSRVNRHSLANKSKRRSSVSSLDDSNLQIQSGNASDDSHDQIARSSSRTELNGAASRVFSPPQSQAASRSNTLAGRPVQLRRTSILLSHNDLQGQLASPPSGAVPPASSTAPAATTGSAAGASGGVHASMDVSQILNQSDALHRGLQKRFQSYRRKSIAPESQHGGPDTYASAIMSPPSMQHDQRHGPHNRRMSMNASMGIGALSGTMGGAAIMSERIKSKSNVALASRPPLSRSYRHTWRKAYLSYVMAHRLIQLDRRLIPTLVKFDIESNIDPDALQTILKTFVVKSDTVLTQKVLAYMSSNKGSHETDRMAQLLSMRLRSFAGYSVEQRRELCKAMHYEKYNAGKLILKEGHPAFSLYFILSGQVDVFTIRDDIKYRLNMHNAGDCFGERGIRPVGHEDTQSTNGIPGIGSVPGEQVSSNRATSFSTTAPTELLRIDKADYAEILRLTSAAMHQKYVLLLTSMPHFNTTNEIVEKILRNATFLSYQPQEVIIMENCKYTDMYWIISGTCRCDKIVPFVKRKSPKSNDTLTLPYTKDMPLGKDDRVVYELLTLFELQHGASFPGMPAPSRPIKDMYFNKSEYVVQLLTSGSSSKGVASTVSIVSSSHVEVMAVPHVEYSMIATADMVRELLEDEHFKVPLAQIQEAYIERTKWDSYRKQLVGGVGQPRRQTLSTGGGMTSGNSGSSMALAGAVPGSSK